MATRIEEDQSIFGKGRIEVYHMNPNLPPETEAELMRQIRGESVGFTLPRVELPQLSFEHHSSFSALDAQVGTPDPTTRREFRVGVMVRGLAERIGQVLKTQRFKRAAVIQGSVS